MKKLVRRFPVVVVAFFVAVMALIACARPAYATERYRPKVYPVTTGKLFSDGFKFNKNLTYIEVCSGVVKNDKGDGYVIGHKDWYISYQYKGHPKKGTKVYSLFQLDSDGDHEALNRKDFVIDEKTGAMKEIYKSY